MVTEEAKMETGARILKGKHSALLFSDAMSPFSELGLLSSMSGIQVAQTRALSY